MWGIFQKVVVSDRIATVVNTVYGDPNSYHGVYVIIATVFFAFQIYCDFSSYSNIAIGSAQVLGYKLTNNFKQPYMSQSIKEFWRRWHISLGSWFRDYLYIPLGGNRKGKLKTYINIMIVFLSSGLWHGASINYIVWGGLHGIYQVISDILKPVREAVIKVFKINTKVFSYRIFRMSITFVLVNFTWIFFRSSSFSNAIVMIKNLFVYNPWVINDGSLFTLGLDSKEFFVAIIGIGVIIISDIISNRVNMINILQEQNLVFRWIVYILTILIIIIFGSYGIGYSAQQFIYFQF